jgi:transcriptional regulator with XRE-family HTH domain
MPSILLTEIDQIVGARITALRKEKGVTLTVLAKTVGVSYQQLQKYESGSNRVGAARLQEIEKYLEVPISSLYGDEIEAPVQTGGFASLNLPGAIDLLKAFAEIECAETRRNILMIARAAARISQLPVERESRRKPTAPSDP